jgi:uncharacterized repeat protein (TIGR03803 family)
MLGCASVGPVSATDAVTYTEKVLASFCSEANCTDGAIPSAPLTHIGSTLYGTTSAGGNYGGGTAFAIDLKSGKKTVLHSFGNGGDGANPQAGLLVLNGILYGTTTNGGAGSSLHCNGRTCGTVFSIDPNTGSETALYSFCGRPNCGDGAQPFAGLIAVNGVLYGTTSRGGAHFGPTSQFGGTVFSLDPNTGTETVLYTFCSQRDCADGADPVAGLLDVRGMLYGTTGNGGGNDCGGVGCGTVFSLDLTTGAETLLHAFKDDSNGFFPLAGLIDAKGTLYGTTVFGGNFEGTVFAMDRRTGAETVVYAFCTQGSCTDDGHQPQAGLVNANGTLYGTTYYGGAPAGGTVFAIDMATGSETVAYTFCSEANCADGQAPTAGLININGTLYGTTAFGGTGQEAGICTNGAYYGNCGTVFALANNRAARMR